MRPRTLGRRRSRRHDRSRFQNRRPTLHACGSTWKTRESRSNQNAPKSPCVGVLVLKQRPPATRPFEQIHADLGTVKDRDFLIFLSFDSFSGCPHVVAFPDKDTSARRVIEQVHLFLQTSGLRSLSGPTMDPNLQQRSSRSSYQTGALLQQRLALTTPSRTVEPRPRWKLWRHSSKNSKLPGHTTRTSSPQVFLCFGMHPVPEGYHLPNSF